MKRLIKLQFIQKLAETQSIKFMTKFDESYFGAKRIRGKRIRGKRGRGAVEKTPVFGLLKRDGRVYVEIVKNCTREQLMYIIQANYSGKNS